ncbi:MAG: glycosyltransferase [Janthinobacterium lividum]
MLELIHDNRSGERLEIVIPTFNERNRIVRVVKFYAPHFDVVILDDDSSDGTKELVIEAGGSVFRRLDKDVLGEAYLVHYVNTLTKSGQVFYLFADEFVALAEMQQAEHQLFSGKSIVLGRRIDWLYGARLNKRRDVGPRGFSRESAEWAEGNIHSALRHRNQFRANVSRHYIDIHHLHVVLAATQYGSTGQYASLEIADFRKTRWPFLRFMRRFFVSEVLLLPRKLWKERGKHWTIVAQIAMLSITTFCIGMLCWIEARFLPGRQEQQEYYAGFYHKDAAEEEQKSAEEAPNKRAL